MINVDACNHRNGFIAFSSRTSAEGVTRPLRRPGASITPGTAQATMIGSMKASPVSKQIGIPNNISRVRSDTGAAQSLPNSPLNSFTERYGDKLNISSPPRRFADPNSLPSQPPRVQSPIAPIGRVTGFSVKNTPGDQGIPLSTSKPTQRGLLGKAFDRDTVDLVHVESQAFQVRISLHLRISLVIGFPSCIAGCFHGQVVVRSVLCIARAQRFRSTYPGQSVLLLPDDNYNALYVHDLSLHLYLRAFSETRRC